MPTDCCGWTVGDGGGEGVDAGGSWLGGSSPCDGVFGGDSCWMACGSVGVTLGVSVVFGRYRECTRCWRSVKWFVEDGVCEPARTYEGTCGCVVWYVLSHRLL